MRGTTRLIFFWGYMIFFFMSLVRLGSTFVDVDLERVRSLDNFILAFAGIVSATKVGDKVVEMQENKFIDKKNEDKDEEIR